MQRYATGLVVAGAVIGGVLAGSTGIAAADSGSSSGSASTGSGVVDTLTGSSNPPRVACSGQLGAPCEPGALLHGAMRELVAALLGPAGSA